MKKVFLDITPPIVWKAITRQIERNRNRIPEWEYIPDGWDYATTHREVRGWNVQEVLDRSIQNWQHFVLVVQGTKPLGITPEALVTTNEDVYSHNTIMSFAYALMLASWQKKQLSILDWGGGIGYYFILAKALLPEVEIEYHVKDVSLLAEYGAILFPDADFYSDNRYLERKYDFVLASASLQYAQDWQTLLIDLANVSSDYLYIANLPVVKSSPSFVIIQRPYKYGYNTEYLSWCLNQAEFLQVAERAGLILIREFVYGHQPIIKNAPEQNSYWGYLFKVEKK